MTVGARVELPAAYVGAQAAAVCSGALVAEGCAEFFEAMGAGAGMPALLCDEAGASVRELRQSGEAVGAARLPRATYAGDPPAYVMFTSGSSGRARCVAASVVGARAPANACLYRSVFVCATSCALAARTPAGWGRRTHAAARVGVRNTAAWGG